MRNNLFFILKTYVYLIPPIQLMTLVVLSVIELETTYKFSQTLLFHLGANNGSSTATLLVYVAYFFNPKFRHCLFTRCIVIGLILNQILYYLSLLITNELYQQLYTIASFFVAITAYWIYLFRNKK
jgi:hypothetical protein